MKNETRRWGRNARNDDAKSARECLLDAARHCFQERGISSTKIDNIVAQAKVSRRTFYHYFDNKQAVIQAVVEVQSGEFLEQLQANVKYRRPFCNYLVRCLLYIIEYSPATPYHDLIVGSEQTLGATRFYRTSEVIQKSWIEFLQPYYQQALADNEINPSLSLEKIENWMGRISLSYLQYPEYPFDKKAIKKDIEMFFIEGIKHR